MTKVIPFSKTRAAAFTFSILLTIAGIVGTILQGGFNFAVEFQAGLSLRIAVDPASVSTDIAGVRNAVSGALDSGVDVQAVGVPGEQHYTLKVSDRGNLEDFEIQATERLSTALSSAFGESGYSIVERTYIGPSFSTELTSQAVWLVILVMLVMLIYLWFRFRLAYASAAVISLAHVVILSLGLIGTLQMEISTALIAAVLTIIGYSINDTIVIFDRIRENEKLMSDAKPLDIIDTSITQSLNRTLMTSITTLVAVLAIFIFTTGPIKDFAAILIFGIIVGTYSSNFIASPLFFSMSNIIKAVEKKRDEAKLQAKTSAKPVAKPKAISKKK